MNGGIGYTAPAVGKKEITMAAVYGRGAIEEEAGGDEGCFEQPRSQDHLLGLLPGHLEAEGVNNGVEAVHRDGQQHVHLHPRTQVLQVTYHPAGSGAQRPAARDHLQQDEGCAAQAHQKICTGHRHHKVVGSGLSPSAAVDNQADQGVSQDGDQPEEAEDQAQDGDLACNQFVGGHGPIEAAGRRGLEAAKGSGV